MNLSELKWLKNVKPDQGWAYERRNEMSIPEARIFRLHWKNQDSKANAQKPMKGDLIALVQLAKVTHIVELLDNTVYENTEKEWGLYRIVKAVWMPPVGFDWSKLENQREIFCVKALPQDGDVHDLRSDGMKKFNQSWKDSGELQGFQQHLDKILTQI